MLRFLVIATIFIISSTAFAEELVFFPDPNLKSCIESALGISDPNASDVLSLTRLNGYKCGISDLTGIEYCQNLTRLEIGYNSISDIDKLSELHNLEVLLLGGNRIENIKPLESLTNLRHLVLSDNEVNDIDALSQLNQITNLQLGGNNLEDIRALQDLVSLEVLFLGRNQIKDIDSLANLTNITYLILIDNLIADISALSGLVKLTNLNLGDNLIVDIGPVTSLTNLERLQLQENYITDIHPLGGLTNLIWLRLNNNFICDISSLADLVNLQELHLENNCIKTIEALQDMTELSYLNLHRNWISDVSPLVANSGITEGDKIIITHNLLTEETYKNDIQAELLPRLGIDIDDTTFYDPCTPGCGDPCVLDFPIYWAKGKPYTKFFPIDPEGEWGWSCGQVAHAMILRYWSFKDAIKPQGIYWYRDWLTDWPRWADYDIPFRWTEMLPSISNFSLSDTRVDPIADLAWRIHIGLHSQWNWSDPDGAPWHREYGYKELIVKHFGIDPSEYYRGSISSWVGENSWEDLYARINMDIDKDCPCELVVTSMGGGVHEVVITGYRKAEDHFEYSIHFGGSDYDPSQWYRLDRPIRGWDRVDGFMISWGIKPYKEPNSIPIYNKVDEYDGQLNWNDRSAIAWNGESFAALLPIGQADSRGLLFQGILYDGCPDPNLSQVIYNGGVDPLRPALAWGDGYYASAWQYNPGTGKALYFNLINSSGIKKLPQDILIAEDAGWPAIAFNGTDFGLVWEQSSHIKFLRITGDGVPLWDSLIDLGRRKNPDIIWNGNIFAVTWVDNSSLQLALLNSEGRLQGETSTIVFPDAVRCDESVIVYSGDGFGISWTEDIGNDRRIMYFCRATSEGQLLPESIVEVSDRGGKVRNLDISYRNDQFYLTYRHCCNYEAYLSRISRNGELLETRWLFNNPASVSSTLGENGLCILQMRNLTYFNRNVIEVETCMIPLVPNAE